MNTYNMNLLVVIAEAILKDRLIHAIRDAGAKGFTVTEVSGEGSRHRRVGELLGENIKIEVIANRETADRILSTLQQDFFPLYAVIAYLTEVQVVRENKYT